MRDSMSFLGLTETPFRRLQYTVFADDYLVSAEWNITTNYGT